MKNNLIIYTDGGARGNPGPAAIGYVAFAVKKGGALQELTRKGETIGSATNNQAEYRALIAALAYDERGLARLFLSGSFEGDIDTAGRVLIPENLKAYANLGGKALVAGVADRVEIWEEHAWRAYTEKIEREADSLAERVNER